MERSCEICGKELTSSEQKASDKVGYEWCAICAMRKHHRLQSRPLWFLSLEQVVGAIKGLFGK